MINTGSPIPFYHNPRIHIFLTISICLLTTILFWNGLGSGFYLDDEPNLKGLVHLSNPEQLYSFIFANENSRYFSYLTFAAQKNAWINDNPFPLKLVNLLLHLFNTVIIYAIALKISKQFNANTQQSTAIAGICCLVWATAPIQVNTVLYTIQRMTLLAASFTLLAVFIFLTTLTREKKTPSTWFYNALLISICYVFGILSKENAILIGLYLAVILYTSKLHQNTPGWWRLWIIIAPISLVFIYLIFHHQLNYNGRDFTLEQRIITEANIVCDYARKIIFSLPPDISLFYDDYPFFKDLSSDKTAILYCIIIVLTLALSIVFHKKYPVLCFSILWFYAGHLLESTIIPLELYFEHRNYLPSFGIFYGLAYFITTNKQYKIIIWPIAIALFLNNLITTTLEVRSWNNKEQFALDAIIDRPYSTRGIQTGATYYLSIGQPRQSAILIDHAHKNIKPYTSHLLSLVVLKCLDNSIALQSFDNLSEEINTLPADRYIEQFTHQIFNIKQGTSCEYLSWDNYLHLLDVLQLKYTGGNSNFFIMHKTMVYQLQGNTTAALNNVIQINENIGPIDQGFFKVYMLLEYDRKDDAKKTLNRIVSRYKSSKFAIIHKDEIAHLMELTSSP